MKLVDLLIRSTLSLAFALTAVAASGADYPAPKEDDWLVRDFRFHTGDVLPSCAFITRPWALPLASRC